MKKIKLPHNQFALVDNEDFDYLNQWRWRTTPMGYVFRMQHVRMHPTIKKKQIQRGVYMHKLIMKAPQGKMVDHINNDQLDNRKKNLRVCTRQQNNFNQAPVRNKTSKYKGVHLERLSKKWRAAIMHNRKTIQLGKYETEVEAARAYDKAATKYHGEFAWLNKDNYGI